MFFLYFGSAETVSGERSENADAEEKKTMTEQKSIPPSW